MFDLCPLSGLWNMNLHDVVANSLEDPVQIVVVSSKHDWLAQLRGISARLRHRRRMECLLFWNWRSLFGARRLTLLVTAGEPSSCSKWNADVMSSPVRAGMNLCTPSSVPLFIYGISLPIVINSLPFPGRACHRCPLFRPTACRCRGLSRSRRQAS